MADLDKRVKEIFNDLHAIPEIGFQEVKTSKYLAEALTKAGYEVKTGLAGGTGITGMLRSGKPGPTVGLRADIDALAHEIDGKHCAIHSCGHDSHSSIVLTVAEEIMRRGITQGNVKIIFQPAEELLFGALRMVEDGAVDDVDILLGLHLRPAQEAKGGQATPALYHGASYVVEAQIEGLTAHGARPHLGINAIDAAAAVIQAVNAIRINPIVPATAKTTQIQAGGPASNAIPANAKLTFDLRAQENPVMEELIEKVKNAVEFGAKTVGAKGVATVKGGCPAAEYDKEMVALVREAMVEVLGEENVLPEIVTPGGEDFHFYVKKKPSLKTAYFGLGVDLVPGLHSPDMKFNQDFLINGVNILLYAVEKLSGNASK